MKIIKTLTMGAAKAVLQSKKNSPHVFFGAGLGGVGLATFLACRSTLRVEGVLDEAKENVEATKARGPYESEAHENLAVAGALVTGVVNVGKLYAPSIVIGTLGVAALTGSHVQLTRRNTALMGSLAATIKGWNEYRTRVADEIGREKELDIYRGVEDAKVKNPDGSKEKVKVRKPGQAPLSPYAKCFDEQSIHWHRNAEMNYSFVRLQQEMANHDLRAKGYLFLNDVYKALGFEPTTAGQIVGWYLNGNGDGYVDFGLNEVTNADFAQGHERSAWLDFNVDGPIADNLEEY